MYEINIPEGQQPNHIAQDAGHDSTLDVFIGWEDGRPSVKMAVLRQEVHTKANLPRQEQHTRAGMVAAVEIKLNYVEPPAPAETEVLPIVEATQPEPEVGAAS